jgi:5-methylcytosine-specific restriction protein A
MPRTGYMYDYAWRRVRLTILRRDGYLCQIRGPRCTGEATEVDHIVPIIVGGARLDPANLRAACQACNGDRRFQDRRSEPVARPSRQW